MEGKGDDSKLNDPKSVSSKVLEYYQKFSQSSELPKYFCGSSESFKILPRVIRGDDSYVEESFVEVACQVSPASSVASNRKLEWDNGADIGYSNANTNLILHKSISLPVLNTIEYEKLQETLLRLSPEGNDNEIPPQQPSSTTSESVPSKHDSVASTSSSSHHKIPPPPISSSSSASTSKSFVLKDFMKKIGLPMAESTPYSKFESISSLETPRLTNKPTRNPRTIISSPSKSSSCENLSLPKSDNLKMTKPMVVDCESKLMQTSLPKRNSTALQIKPRVAVKTQHSSDESSEVESKRTKSDNLKPSKSVVVDNRSENKLIQTSLPKSTSIALQTKLRSSSHRVIQRSSDESSDMESKNKFIQTSLPKSTSIALQTKSSHHVNQRSSDESSDMESKNNLKMTKSVVVDNRSENKSLPKSTSIASQTKAPSSSNRGIVNTQQSSGESSDIEPNLKVTKSVVVDCGTKSSKDKCIQTSLPRNASIALQTETLPDTVRSSDESSNVESKCTSFEYHSGTDYIEETPKSEEVENKPNSSESSTEIPLAELLAINRSEHDAINLQRNLELMQKLIKSKKYSNVTKKHYLKKIAKKMIDNSGNWTKGETTDQEDKSRLPSEKEEETNDGMECGHKLQPRYQSGTNFQEETESSLEIVSECAHSLKTVPSKSDAPTVTSKSSKSLTTQTFTNEILPKINAKTEGSRLRRNPLFTLASHDDAELKKDTLKGARGDSNTSVETSQTVTLSSSSSETRTKDWREDTTRSEKLREQNKTPSGEHLLHYASKEREHQLGWIKNEISHLSKLKKLLEMKDSKKKGDRHTALQKVLQKPVVEDMRGIKKATTVYVLTTEQNGNSSKHPCGCCRPTCIANNQPGNVAVNLENNRCICGNMRGTSPTPRSPSLVGRNVNVDEVQNLRMVSNECFTTQQNANNGRTTVRRYTFELPIEPSTSKSTEFGSIESGKSSKYSKPSSNDTNLELGSLNSDPPRNCIEQSPCKKCCVPKAPKLGCQLVISGEGSARPQSPSPTDPNRKKCECCTCGSKNGRPSQEPVAANEVVAEPPPVCICCSCKPVPPRNGRLSRQSFPNDKAQIVIRHRSRSRSQSPPPKCLCCKCAKKELAAELVSSDEFVIETKMGSSKENQTCMCCVCKNSKFSKSQRLSNEFVSAEEIIDQSTASKNKICMCTVQGDDKENQTCVCCTCQTSQTDKKSNLIGELVSSEDIVGSYNRLMAPKTDRPSQTAELNRMQNLSSELVLSEEIVNRNRSISPMRNKTCACKFLGDDKENQTCTCCECFIINGETQTLQKVVGEESMQTQDDRRSSQSHETQTLAQRKALEASLFKNEIKSQKSLQNEVKRPSQSQESQTLAQRKALEASLFKNEIKSQKSLQSQDNQKPSKQRTLESALFKNEIKGQSQKSLEEEEMRRKLLESDIDQGSPRGDDADQLSKAEETQTQKPVESDSLKSSTSRSSSSTTTTQSMLCQCCKKSNGRPPPVIINQEKIYLCNPCSSQTRGVNYCSKPTFMYPGHVCQCPPGDTIRKIRETIRELESLEREEEYCKCMLNDSRSKTEHCARCKCKIKSKYNANKGGLAYLLTLESDDKLDFDETGEEPRELKEIKVKIPSRRHRRSRDDDREKGSRDESPEGRKKEKRSSESKNHEKKRRNSRRESRHPSLQEYLCTNRPEFVCCAEERRKCLLELAYMREERCQKYKQLLALSDGIPPEGSVNQRPSLFSHGDMIRTTSKKYSQLPEVQKKISDAKEQQSKKANKMLADIFNQKLRQKVLRGVHTLPTSASVIKF